MGLGVHLNIHLIQSFLTMWGFIDFVKIDSEEQVGVPIYLIL